MRLRQFALAFLLSLGLAPGARAQVAGVGAHSGPVSAVATPANSSHAAGTSIGGLFQLALGDAGIITSFWWKSTGASTGQLLIRIWDKNPVNTTCTDNVAFAGSDVDDANLIAPPFTITPAAPAIATGDAATYASQLGMTLDFKTADIVAAHTLYVCPITVGVDTADQNHQVRATISGPLY